MDTQIHVAENRFSLEALFTYKKSENIFSYIQTRKAYNKRLVDLEEISIPGRHQSLNMNDFTALGQSKGKALTTQTKGKVLELDSRDHH